MTLPGFLLMLLELYELWSAVYDWATHADRGANQYIFVNAGVMGTDNIGTNQQPVTSVIWRDAIVWCNALTEYYNSQNGTSLACIYTSDSGFITPIRTSSGSGSYFLTQGEIDNPFVNPDAKGFRLPTSAEWGAAARYKGSDSSNGAYEHPASNGYYWTPGNYVSGDIEPYDTSTTIGDYAVYDDGIVYTTAAVKTKEPNALGLYDMSGNVSEWNFDWHPDSPNDYRVYRGGCWFSSSAYLEVGYYFDHTPDYESDALGFRFCKTP